MCATANTSLTDILNQALPGILCALIAVLLTVAARVIYDRIKLCKRKEVVLKALHRETSANIKQSAPWDYRKHAGLALSCECCKVIIHDPDLSNAVGKKLFAKTLEVLAALNAVESRYQFLHPDIMAAEGRSNEFAPLESALNQFQELSKELEKSIPEKFKIEKDD